MPCIRPNCWTAHQHKQRQTKNSLDYCTDQAAKVHTCVMRTGSILPELHMWIGEHLDCLPVLHHRCFSEPSFLRRRYGFLHSTVPVKSTSIAESSLPLCCAKARKHVLSSVKPMFASCMSCDAKRMRCADSGIGGLSPVP